MVGLLSAMLGCVCELISGVSNIRRGAIPAFNVNFEPPGKKKKSKFVKCACLDRNNTKCYNTQVYLQPEIPIKTAFTSCGIMVNESSRI